MKKFVLAFILISFTQLVFGQGWQPVYLNEAIYYTSSSTPDEPFGVFASDLSFDMDSSDVKIALRADTVEVCSCLQSDCRILKANFLQNKIVYSDSGVVVFQNPDTLTFRTLAHTGDSWIFKNDDEMGEIMATIISESVMDILGQTDSVKTITLSNGEEIDLSKNHGIILWSKPEFTLSIHSIPKRNLGEVYLTKSEVYDFEVGDVFAYVIDSYKLKYPGASVETRMGKFVVRLDVLSIDNQQAMRTITVLRNYIEKHHSEYDPYYGSPYYLNSLESIADTIVLEINLESFDPLYELPENTYWNKPIDMQLNQDFVSNMVNVSSEYDFDFFWLGYNFTANPMHHKTFNNRRALHFGFESFDMPFTPLNTISDFMSYDFDGDYTWDPENIDYLLRGCGNYYDNPEILPGETLEIANDYNYYSDIPRQSAQSTVEGIGVVAFYNEFIQFESSEGIKAKLIGYKKGEETMGFIPDVGAIMSVGIENAKKQIGFSVFPNPASNTINILMPTSGFGKLRLFDISGRVLYTMPINSEKSKIETGQFPSGVYFIQVETQKGIGVEKVIISR